MSLVYFTHLSYKVNELYKISVLHSNGWKKLVFGGSFKGSWQFIEIGKSLEIYGLYK